MTNPINPFTPQPKRHREEADEKEPVSPQASAKRVSSAAADLFGGHPSPVSSCFPLSSSSAPFCPFQPNSPPSTPRILPKFDAFDTPPTHRELRGAGNEKNPYAYNTPAAPARPAPKRVYDHAFFMERYKAVEASISKGGRFQLPIPEKNIWVESSKFLGKGTYSNAYECEVSGDLQGIYVLKLFLDSSNPQQLASMTACQLLQYAQLMDSPVKDHVARNVSFDACLDQIGDQASMENHCFCYQYDGVPRFAYTTCSRVISCTIR